MTILALGGPVRLLVDYVLGLTGKEDPSVCLLAQGTGEAHLPSYYDLFTTHRCRPSHVALFGIPRPDWREHLLSRDVIFVGGGNTASMLAVWRAHGVDSVLSEAWERGVVLAGGSAGAICWFETGVTDSFREELDGLDCLGWLPGSCCPHYDGEANRRPAYRRLLAEGFPPGIAIDDHAGVRYEGTELVEVVSAVEGAGAYRVDRDGETPLPVRGV
ncbi:MAG: peptidase E [Gaiellaceae bacterium]